jgi:hypothetical protein
MALESPEWKPIVWLPVTPSLNLPSRNEAREQAKVAAAIGLGLLAFGLIVLVLLP